MKTNPVLALDIGGTKVAAAVVDETGRILFQLRQNVVVHQGPDAFVDQVVQIISQIRADFEFEKVGIGCAGPLDSVSGDLLDPTNFLTDGKSWGRTPLLAPLRSQWPKWTFALDNDAAAAVVGEAWLGGEPKENLLAMTLGTGVGVGVLVNGRLVRQRGELHPEASHIPLNYSDPTAPCGCGNFGCIEAYLAGSHFVQRLAREWNAPDLTGPLLIARAEKGEPSAHTAFAQYGEWLAQAIHAFAVLYGPEHISLSGGFAKGAPYFLPVTQRRLPELLGRRRVAGADLVPTVEVSRLGENQGLLGAARLVQLFIGAK